MGPSQWGKSGPSTRRKGLARGILAFALLIAAVACAEQPNGGAWCSDQASKPSATKSSATTPSAAQGVTWSEHIAPIVAAKCALCHDGQGIGGLRLTSRDDFAAHYLAVQYQIERGLMPPWLAAPCCNQYLAAQSLSPTEAAQFADWLGHDLPVGPTDSPTPTAATGSLSRTDLVLHGPAFTPQPPAGHEDEMRCFVLDAAAAQGKFVTGLKPMPTVRKVVHHLIVAAVDGDDALEMQALQGKDGRPGFDCAGGLGSTRKSVTILGGSLLGGDFPRGIGKAIRPSDKIVLNIHYSTAGLAQGEAMPTDQTDIALRLDDDARDIQAIVVANPGLLMGDAMRVPAGVADAPFWFHFKPTLFTLGKQVYLQNVNVHMHTMASKAAVRILHANGDQTCLLEIPRWDFGWEQPYWFTVPVALQPDDELYLECHFDNSAGNQPPGKAPADFAWGESGQEMCAAFLGFTDKP